MKRILLLIAMTLSTLGLTTVEASAFGPREIDTVRNWYQRYLGRDAEPQGAIGWAQQLDCRPARDVLAGILGSPEYFHRHGCTPEGFVTALYYEVLGRQPAPHEVQNWVVRLCHLRGNRECMAREFLCAAGNELATRPVFIPPPNFGQPQ